MGRTYVPHDRRNSIPTGPRWTEFRRHLFATIWRDTVCAYCLHPGASEVEHRLSSTTHPELAWQVGNLLPVHGAGRRRCSVCSCSCNNVSAGNQVPRDEQGRPVAPWPAEFAARKSAEARASLAARGVEVPKAPDPVVIPVTGPRPAPPGAIGAEYDDVAGRVVWACGQVAMRHGQVRDRTPGSGCEMVHSWNDNGVGRCW